MSMLEERVVEVVNGAGRIGIIGTTDSKGQPNLAYFGSARVLSDGKLMVILGDNRTLQNLEENPNAVFMGIKESPVTFKTPGWRLYLKVSKIHREGEVLESAREQIAKRAGAKMAETLIAAVIFDITDVRPFAG